MDQRKRVGRSRTSRDPAVLLRRFEQRPDLSLLDEVFARLRNELGNAASGGARAPLVNALGFALIRRFEYVGNPDDLDEAVGRLREAVAADAGSAMYRSNLGVALRSRWHYQRDPADLDEAVRWGEAAVRGTADAEDPGMYLAMLGLTLRARAEYAGDAADLDRAVEVLRAAVSATRPHNAHFLGRARSLTSVLASRYDLGRSAADLDEAVGVAAAWAEGGSGPAAARGLLAACLSARYDRTFDPGDLDDAIRAARDAAREATDTDRVEHLRQLLKLQTPPGDPSLASRYSNLSLLLQRTHATESWAVAEEAVELARAAVGLAGGRAPMLAMYWIVLGNALLVRHAHSDSPADLDEAVTAYQYAVGVNAGEPDRRIAAAREWATVEAKRGRWASAVKGYVAAAKILDAAVWPGLNRADRERKLLDLARDLGTEGAAGALSAYQVNTAVGLAEAGRAVIWSQVLNSRADLTRLSTVDPQLAARLEAVRAAAAALDAVRTA